MLPALVFLCYAATVSLQDTVFLLKDHDGLVELGPRADDPSVRTRLVPYADGSLQLTGYLATPADIGTGSRPGILIAHDYNGRDDFENGKAVDLAKMGYIAFAHDIFGVVGNTTEQNLALQAPFMQDRQLYMRRVQLSLTQLKQAPGVNQSAILLGRNGIQVGHLKSHFRPEISWPEMAEEWAQITHWVGGIGFCFGGVGVLDMARTNAPGVQAVVGFHGVLDPLPTSSPGPIQAKVLDCHGFNDTTVTMDKVLAFENEMTQRQTDWQLVVYGNNTNHGFMVPGPRYQPESARRAWREMTNLFQDVFNLPSSAGTY